ncbi:unnamed protein product, partial [Tuber aestivum]
GKEEPSHSLFFFFLPLFAYRIFHQVPTLPVFHFIPPYSIDPVLFLLAFPYSFPFFPLGCRADPFFLSCFILLLFPSYRYSLTPFLRVGGQPWFRVVNAVDIGVWNQCPGSVGEKKIRAQRHGPPCQAELQMSRKKS